MSNEQLFQVIENTKWHNPTDRKITLELYKGIPYLNDTSPHANKYRPRIKVEIAPGQTAEIPKEYNEAIQTTYQGKVVGGLAPQLLNKSVEVQPTPDPGLSDTAVAIPNAETAVKNGVEVHLKSNATKVKT